MALIVNYEDAWTQYKNYRVLPPDDRIQSGATYRELAEYNLQMIRQVLMTAGFDLVPEILKGAPIDLKVQLWGEWASQSDLSGYTSVSVLTYLSEEPPDVVEAILKQWVQKVKLDNYGLAEMVKTALCLHHHDDVLLLWKRWADAYDLRKYSLRKFVKSLLDFSPEVQAICMVAYLKRVDINAYKPKERNKWFDQLSLSAREAVGDFIRAPEVPDTHVQVFRSITAHSRDEALAEYFKYLRATGKATIGQDLLTRLHVEQYNGGMWAVCEQRT